MSRKNLVSPINDDYEHEQNIETISRHSIESLDDTRPGSKPINTDSPTNPSSLIQPKIKIINENNNNKANQANHLPIEHDNHATMHTNLIKKRIRKILLFLITNFGMLGLVLGYVVLGALLFQTLEQTNEIQNCETGKGNENEMISEYTQKLFNYIYFNVSTDPVVDALIAGQQQVDQNLTYNINAYTTIIDDWILEVRDLTINNFLATKYSGQDDCEAKSLWQLPSAILFTVTIVTTIGYGHVTPLTWQGQIVIICYATFGIPLFLMTTAKISVMLSNIFAFFFKNVILFPCNYLAGMNESKQNKKKSKTEKRSAWNEGDEDEDDDDDDDKEDEDAYSIDKSQHSKVPLIIILSFFAGYLVMGGFVFQNLESVQSWSLISSIYYSYVSLSTIGFGDFVPGIYELQNGDLTTATRNILLAVVYIFVGISVLGMCFNLMNSTIVDRISSISDHIKFIKSQNFEVVQHFDHNMNKTDYESKDKRETDV